MQGTQVVGHGHGLGAIRESWLTEVPSETAFEVGAEVLELRLQPEHVDLLCQVALRRLESTFVEVDVRDERQPTSSRPRVSDSIFTMWLRMMSCIDRSR